MAIEELQPKWRHVDKKMPLIVLRERLHPLNAPPCKAADVRKVAGKVYSLAKDSRLQLQATKYSNDWTAKHGERMACDRRLRKVRPLHLLMHLHFGIVMI